MVHYFLLNGGMRYGPGSATQRHDDRGGLSSKGHALDEFKNPFLEFDQTDDANLEPKVAQQAADIILNNDGFILQ